MDDKLAPARANPALFDTFRKSIEREARGYLAPFKCIEAVQAAVTLPFAEGMKKERELFQELMENVEHHVKEKEEGDELFPIAESELGDEVEDLGAKM